MSRVRFNPGFTQNMIRQHSDLFQAWPGYERILITNHLNFVIEVGSGGDMMEYHVVTKGDLLKRSIEGRAGEDARLIWDYMSQGTD